MSELAQTLKQLSVREMAIALKTMEVEQATQGLRRLFYGEFQPSELSGRMREIERLTDKLRLNVNHWLDEWANGRKR